MKNKLYIFIGLIIVLLAVLFLVRGCSSKPSNNANNSANSVTSNNDLVANDNNNNKDDNNTPADTSVEPSGKPGEETTPSEAPTGTVTPEDPSVDPTGAVTEGPKEENPSLTPDANVTNTPAPNVTAAPDATPDPTRMPGATATPTPTKRVDNPGNNTSVPTQTPVLSKIPTATPTPTKVPTATPTPTKVPVSTSTPTPTPTPHIVSYILVVDKKVATEVSNDGSLVLYYFENDTAPDYPYITSHTKYTAEMIKEHFDKGRSVRSLFLSACNAIPSAYHYDEYYVIGTEEITVDVDYVYPNGTYGVIGSDGWIHAYKIKNTVGCVYSDGRVVRY